MPIRDCLTLVEEHTWRYTLDLDERHESETDRGGIETMSWMLALGGVILLFFAAFYARHFQVGSVGFGPRFLPRAKQFIDDVKDGAMGVGIAPCEGCGYEGQERRFRHVANLYLCDHCHGYTR